MTTFCRTERYRIYPSSEQVRRLTEWQDALRFLWNIAHEQRLMAQQRCRHGRKYYTAFDQIRDVPALRSELPWLADVPAESLNQLLVDLDYSWQRCRLRVTERPTWKKKGDDWLGIRASAGRFRVESAALVFPKMGRIDAVFHRPLRGKVRACTIKKDVDQWYALIACEIEHQADSTLSAHRIGIDRGLVNLIADSDGRVVARVRGWPDRLARAQRRASKKKKGSKNREKANLVVARIYRKARRQRDAVLHRESLYYAKNHSVVVIEKLNVREMTKSASGTAETPGRMVAQKSGLNRSILNAGWGRLACMLRYKLEWYGGALIEAPAQYTSQTCSTCGHVDAESRRSQSEFECVSCGNRLHADVNAAKVILSRGTHGGAVCGGTGARGRPMKQKLLAVRPRRKATGLGPEHGTV